MNSQQTLSALQRASTALRQAWDSYCAQAASGGKTTEERRTLDRAMDAYETAVANHQKALAEQIAKMRDDPRHVRPPRGETKGL